jgi:allophanate hydrolase
VWRASRRILAEPILLNTRLGAYTNCVNLLGLCGVAVPAALRADGTPFGITSAPLAIAFGTAELPEL